MSDKFATRIELERKVLRSVNNTSSGMVQLAGLSEAAINNWKASCNIPNAEKIAVILHRLNELTLHLSRSGQMLKALEEKLSDKLKIEFEILLELLPKQ